jgi:16S rRNA (adenine1518-N6/adenine1519-N6)-dimethyltransferase
MTLTRKQVIELLESRGMNPSRALGQNFVVDPNTVRKIARLADVGEGDHVVEIGPGLGSLTLALAETGASIRAVEIDRYLLPILRDQVRDLDVEVIEGDAMEIDWSTVLRGESHVLVANLPYNISVPLIADLLDGQPLVHRMLVMVQKEVGERLCSPPGSKAYGGVSVKIAYWADATMVGMVPPSVFLPQPNVDSALVMITRRAAPAVDPALVSAEALFSLVRQGFGKRRKMLRGSLAGVVTTEMFAEANVRPEARPEELDVYAWGRLAVAAQLQLMPSIAQD